MAVKTLRSMPRESYPGAGALRYDAVDTPAGPVSFATDGERVRRVLLGERREDAAPATPLDRETKRQLREYFAGKRREFDLPTAADLPPFTARVLAEVARIPFGASRSYGEVARAVGRPRAARAVGQAVGSNPLPLLVPCHRVLAAEGALGGFGGGLSWKRFLLDLEGISYGPPASPHSRASRASRG
jgi:methylated-DNA-[protein]-cysteine S-methyltransferase